jgi:hypothetical protein
VGPNANVIHANAVDLKQPQARKVAALRLAPVNPSVNALNAAVNYQMLQQKLKKLHNVFKRFS